MGSLKILCGNIVDDRFLMLGDAIVNPTNPMMRMGSGVSEAIFKKAGIDKLEQYTEQQFKISYSDSSRKNEMKPTEIRVTPGFRIDECPMIYKPMDEIISHVKETVTIDKIIKPIYNFKASEKASEKGQ